MEEAALALTSPPQWDYSYDVIITHHDVIIPPKTRQASFHFSLFMCFLMNDDVIARHCLRSSDDDVIMTHVGSIFYFF